MKKWTGGIKKQALYKNLDAKKQDFFAQRRRTAATASSVATSLDLQSLQAKTPAFKRQQVITEQRAEEQDEVPVAGQSPLPMMTPQPNNISVEIEIADLTPPQQQQATRMSLPPTQTTTSNKQHQQETRRTSNIASHNLDLLDCGTYNNEDSSRTPQQRSHTVHNNHDDDDELIFFASTPTVAPQKHQQAKPIIPPQHETTLKQENAQLKFKIQQLEQDKMKYQEKIIELQTMLLAMQQQHRSTISWY